MSETTSTPSPSTGWTHVALFLLLWIEQPVGTSPQGPLVSQEQPQEPMDRETFLDSQNQLSSSHILDHPTDSMDGIKTYAHLVCIWYKMQLYAVS